MSSSKTGSRESLKPKVPCSGTGCSRMVNQRRPSASGNHFCDSKECQAERQRLYQAERKKKHDSDLVAEHNAALAAWANKVTVTRGFFWAALHRGRVRCGSCGLVDALPEYAHRDRQGLPCYGVGKSVLYIDIDEIDLVWPLDKREYADA